MWTSTLFRSNNDLLKVVEAHMWKKHKAVPFWLIYKELCQHVFFSHYLTALLQLFKWVALELCKCQLNQQSHWMSTVHRCFMQPLMPFEKAVIVYKVGQWISSHMVSRATPGSLKALHLCPPERIQQELQGEAGTYPLKTAIVLVKGHVITPPCDVASLSF